MKKLSIILLAVLICGAFINFVKNSTEEHTQAYEKCLQENRTSLCNDLFYH